MDQQVSQILSSFSGEVNAQVIQNYRYYFNYKRSDGASFVYIAACNYNKDSLALALIQQGFPIEDPKNGQPLFHIAAVKGWVDLLKEVFKRQPSLDVNYFNYVGISRNNTALAIACSRGDEAVVGVLLSHPKIEVNSSHFESAFTLSTSSTNGWLPQSVTIDAEKKISCAKLLVQNRPENGSKIFPSVCRFPEAEDIFSAILSNPRVDVNVKNSQGKLPSTLPAPLPIFLTFLDC